MVSIAIEAGRPAPRAAALGFIGGLVGFAGTLYWVIAVMGRYGGLALPVAALVGCLLWAYLALYVAVFAWFLRRAILTFGAAGIWFAPPIWVATEWLRSSMIGGFGFPWVLLGTSQADALPVAQLASVVGVYGLSGLLGLVNAAAASLALTPRAPRKPIVAVAVLLVCTITWGAWRMSRSELTTAGAPVRIGLVQGAVEQDQKYDPRYRDEILTRYLDLSRQVIAAGAELVIWPEAATPFYFDLEALLAAPIRRLAVETQTPLIVGTDQFERTPGHPDRYYNSAVLVDVNGSTSGFYRKMQLVPFGEFVPMKSVFFFAAPLIEAVSDFSAGTEATTLLANGRRVSVAICYESIYPAIARAFVANGSELLATITNDAWFGRSSAAYQHFEQGRLRAIEQGRYVVRAANTGISGAVDPYGRVLAETRLFESTAITVDVRTLSTRTIYGRTGDVVVWIAVALTVCLVPLGWRARRLHPGL
jgi:apolipoprotein N-acyltransferase